MQDSAPIFGIGVRIWYTNTLLVYTLVAPRAREAAMPDEPEEVARNEWGAILHYEDRGLLELRWFATTAGMGDDGFRETLELFAGEAERFRPANLLVDSMEFRHRMGEGVNEWRDANIIPRYNAAGVRKFAFVVPEGVPGTVESSGEPAVDGPANFPTGWFSSRDRADRWLSEGSEG